MLWFLIGALLLVLFLAGGRAFVNASPSDLARGIKIGGGILLLALAAILFLARQWFLAMPVAVFGLSLLGMPLGRLAGGSGGRRWQGRAQPSSGQRSAIRTNALDVELDHDTGEISGTILSGGYAGRTFASLTDAELADQWRQFAADEENQRLFEAYLDRRLPGWREDFEADGDAGVGGATFTGPMTKEEAYQLLGLQFGARPDEVRSAHKRLMKMVHPDRGGSTYLASRINEAKDVLLGGRN